MAWDIAWLGSTREQLETLARERFSKMPIVTDIGLLAVKKVEEEIMLHPIPSTDLPQVWKDVVFDFGGIQVCYHIDSEKGQAEVRSVTVAH